MAKTEKEMNYQYFMEEDVSRFSGEWIAVSDDKILSHGRNVKEVAEEAGKKCQGRKFLLARVPSEETMIF